MYVYQRPTFVPKSPFNESYQFAWSGTINDEKRGSDFLDVFFSLPHYSLQNFELEAVLEAVHP